MNAETIHVRYVVMNGDTFMRHHKGFDYRQGNHAVFTTKFAHARLFTRRVDAEKACFGGAVVKGVNVALCN